MVFSVPKFLIVSLAILLVSMMATAEVDIDQANKFIDQIIEKLAHQEKLDPLHIEDSTHHFDKKIGKIHFHGQVIMKNTIIQGLRHIMRNGNADLKSENGSIICKLRLGDNNIKAFSDVHVDLDHVMHPNLKIEADVGHIDVRFTLAIGGATTLKLKEFEVDELNGVEFHVHGLKLLDPLVDLIGDLFVELANKKSRELLTQQIRPVIEKELEHFHF